MNDELRDYFEAEGQEPELPPLLADNFDESPCCGAPISCDQDSTIYCKACFEEVKL